MRFKYAMLASVEAYQNKKQKNLDLNKIERTPSGGILLNVKPMRDGDYNYRAYQVNANIPGVEYNDIVVGRINRTEVRKILDKFEGLPVTDEHKFIKSNKDDIAGHLLTKGKLDSEGFVSSRVVIEDPQLITMIESGEKVEVSIGFYADEPSILENRKEGDPNFYVENIELNHLAVVQSGRAGPKARLYNDSRNIFESAEIIKKPQKQNNGVNQVKIKIGNKEFDLPQDAVEAINAEKDSQQVSLSDTNAKIGELNEKVSKLVGENAALKKEADTAPNAVEKAKELLAQHASLENSLKFLGVNSAISLGDYDAAEVLRDALSEYGVMGIEHSDINSLNSILSGIKAAHGRKSGEGSLERENTLPDQISISHKSDNGKTDVQSKISSNWFGKKTNKGGGE